MLFLKFIYIFLCIREREASRSPSLRVNLGCFFPPCGANIFSISQSHIFRVINSLIITVGTVFSESDRHEIRKKEKEEILLKLCEKNYLLAMECFFPMEAVKSCFLITTTVEGNKAEICHTDSSTLKALLRNHRLIQFQRAGRGQSEPQRKFDTRQPSRSWEKIFLLLNTNFLLFCSWIQISLSTKVFRGEEAPRARVFKQSFRK